MTTLVNLRIRSTSQTRTATCTTIRLYIVSIMSITIDMERPGRFDLVIAPDVACQVEAIDRKYISLIRQTIHEQLAHAPTTPTRNRKPLRGEASLETTWQLRFGPRNRLRLFYDVDALCRRVCVLAAGEKLGTKLYVNGEEIQL